MDLVLSLDADLPYDCKSVAAKKEGCTCFIIGHPMLYFFHCYKKSRVSCRDVDHPVVTRNSRNIVIGFVSSEKAALSQGFSRAETCRSRYGTKDRPLRLAQVE